MKVNKKNHWWQTSAHQLKGVALGAAMIVMGLSGTPLLAETAEGDCIQTAAGFNLNCSANDIQLSEVTEIKILDDGCAYLGDDVTFRATFETILTAKERHDIGIYFAIDGDVNGDGALTGECSVSSLEYQPDLPWLDLDSKNDPYVGENKLSGLQDTCGDIDADHNPLRPVIEITTKCVDNDGNGLLDLPYCTSWRQSGSNELCTGPIAFNFGAEKFSSGVTPGAPSKCNCNPDFNINIEVPPAELKVLKSVVPETVKEPGGSVVYSVSVENTGIDPNNKVALTSLIDNIYGDITVVAGDITATTCAVPVDLSSSGEPYTCTFNVDIAGNAGVVIPDTVTASGTDDRGNTITGSDDANVTITGVAPSIDVTKVASRTSVPEPGCDVDFTVKIVNNSVSSDPVTITSLTDKIEEGELIDLNGKGDCTVGFTIDPGEFYTCTFTRFVGGVPGTSETDEVTASGVDDDDTPVTDSDSATVTINDIPCNIELVKTGASSVINEPGGDLEFTFRVTNKGTVDTVTIESLEDNTYETNLNGVGTCAVPFDLLPGESYECKATFHVVGDAGDTITNTSTASGVDDDGKEVCDADSFTVNIKDVEPSAKLVKTVESVIVNYSVVVTNDSVAESATIDSLMDDIYGNIADTENDLIIETDCTVPKILAKAGSEGDSYTCNFSAEATSSPTTDIVTGVVSDNEENTVSPSDSASVTFE